jgi:hypothetical protein
VDLFAHPAAWSTGIQGCQIFLDTKYQNWKKCAKLSRTIPNVHEV